MIAQQEKKQSGGASSRYQKELAYYPRCSNTKSAHLVKPRQHALKYSYTQANRPGQVSWLIFDLDHPNSLIWEDVGLPCPNFIVRNRQSGNSHLFYAITPVCTTENARSRPIAYMKAIYKAMALELDADPDYSGPVAKTPHHPWWQTTEFHAHEYSLGELAEYVDLVREYQKGKKVDLSEVPESRHCYLFHDLRFFAYSIIETYRKRHTFSAFVKALERFARKNNQFVRRGFEANLPESSIRATVRSVSRWTWDRYHANFVRRGTMGLDPDLPLEERQRLAAMRTNQVRTNTSKARIAKACRELVSLQQPLTIVAVAKQSGLSRQTVSKHKEALSQNHTTTLKPSDANQPKNVKYAVHQIAAALGVCDEKVESDPVHFLQDRAREKPPP